MEAAYNFALRDAKLVYLAKSRYGKDGEWLAMYFSRSQPKDSNFGDLTDMTAGKRACGRGKVEREADQIVERTKIVLANLLRDGLIRPVTRYDANPYSDLQTEAERTVDTIEMPSRATSVRAHNALKQLETDKVLKEWRDEADAFCGGPQAPARKRARTSEPDHSTSSKKRKIAGKQPNGVNDNPFESDRDGQPGVMPSSSSQEDLGLAENVRSVINMNIPLQHNYDKYNAIQRSNCLKEFASRRLGWNAAKVYSAVLRLVEPESRRCYDLFEVGPPGEYPDKLTLQESPPVSARQVLQEVERMRSTDTSQAPASKPNGVVRQSTDASHPRKASSSYPGKATNALGKSLHTTDVDAARLSAVSNHVDFAQNEESEDDVPIRKRKRPPEQHGVLNTDDFETRLEKVELYLEILCASPEGFLKRTGDFYAVPFGKLTPLLILESVLNNITQTPSLGPQAARIVRILAWSGNCSENTIFQRSLLHMREVRVLLNRLSEAGWIDLYPVARDNQRTASRSIFIYRFDLDSARIKILGDTYQAMARLLQRLRVEQEKDEALLEKVSRSDVAGHEDEYLTAAEKEALKRFNLKAARIIMHVGLLDDLVCRVRDWWPLYRDVPTLRLKEFGPRASRGKANVASRDTDDEDEEPEDEEIVEGRESEPLAAED